MLISVSPSTAVTEEDRVWEEGSANVNEETNRDRRAAQAAITELNRANEEALVC